MSTEQTDGKAPKPQKHRPPPKVAAAAHAPYLPAEFEVADAAALQALARGQATAEQQRRALDWVMFKASDYLNEPFRPGGLDGERDTIFAIGRGFVGRQVAKLINLNLSNWRGGKDGEQP